MREPIDVDEYAPYIGAPGKYPPPLDERCAYCQENAPHGMNDHLTAIGVSRAIEEAVVEDARCGWG